MKVGDLVVYNLGHRRPGDEKPKDIGIVVAERHKPGHRHARRNFRVYYPHYNECLNGWEDEYRIIS